MKVLVLGRFVKAQVLVLKAVGKLKSNKDAGKGIAMEMWKAAQNAASHIPTATAAAAVDKCQNPKKQNPTLSVLDFQQLWIHSRYDARKRLDEGAGMAEISGLPARNQ